MQQPVPSSPGQHPGGLCPGSQSAQPHTLATELFGERATVLNSEPTALDHDVACTLFATLPVQARHEAYLGANRRAFAVLELIRKLRLVGEVPLVTIIRLYGATGP